MIRKYEVCDTENLIAVWRRASELAHPFLSQDFMAQEAENMRKLYLPNAEVWVVEIDGDVRGFIALLTSEVGGFFVDPIYHGNGYGRDLMDHAVGLKGDLCVDVFRENSLGRGFYTRYGFQEHHEHVHEASGQKLTHMIYSIKR